MLPKPKFFMDSYHGDSFQLFSLISLSGFQLFLFHSKYLLRVDLGSNLEILYQVFELSVIYLANQVESCLLKFQN